MRRALPDKRVGDFAGNPRGRFRRTRQTSHAPTLSGSRSRHRTAARRGADATAGVSRAPNGDELAAAKMVVAGRTCHRTTLATRDRARIALITKEATTAQPHCRSTSWERPRQSWLRLRASIELRASVGPSEDVKVSERDGERVERSLVERSRLGYGVLWRKPDSAGANRCQ